MFIFTYGMKNNSRKHSLKMNSSNNSEEAFVVSYKHFSTTQHLIVSMPNV